MNHVHENLMVKVTRGMQAAPKKDSNTDKKKAAYEDAFSHVCGYTEDRTIGASQAEKMTMLREWYCSYKQAKYPDFHNPKYIKQKLKRRTADTSGTKINSVKKFSISTYNMRLLFFPSMFFCKKKNPLTKLDKN